MLQKFTLQTLNPSLLKICSITTKTNLRKAVTIDEDFKRILVTLHCTT